MEPEHMLFGVCMVGIWVDNTYIMDGFQHDYDKCEVPAASQLQLIH